MFTRQRYVAGDLTEQSLEPGEVNVSICPNTSFLLLPAIYPLPTSFTSLFPILPYLLPSSQLPPARPLNA